MKKVLLTTSALVAFAGYAAAEVSFGGEVTVGYNDVEEGGIYLSGSLDITGTAEFDNGVSVEVTYGLDLYDGDFDDFPTITVTTEWATLTVGSVEYAAADMFASVDGMSGTESFREQNDEIVARVDATFGGFAVGVSMDAFNNYNPTNQLSIGATGEFGAFSFTAGYDMVNAVVGVSVGGSFGGFDVDVAYMTDTNGDNSIGIGVATTMGGVGLSGYYAINSNDDDAYGVAVDYTAGAMSFGAYWDGDAGGASNFGLTAEYAVSDTITVGGGYDEADSFHVYATMMVGAAEIGASYNDDGDGDQDDDYKAGIDVWLTLPF